MTHVSTLPIVCLLKAIRSRPGDVPQSELYSRKSAVIAFHSAGDCHPASRVLGLPPPQAPFQMPSSSSLFFLLPDSWQSLASYLAFSLPGLGLVTVLSQENVFSLPLKLLEDKAPWFMISTDETLNTPLFFGYPREKGKQEASCGAAEKHTFQGLIGWSH